MNQHIVAALITDNFLFYQQLNLNSPDKYCAFACVPRLNNRHPLLSCTCTSAPNVSVHSKKKYSPNKCTVYSCLSKICSKLNSPQLFWETVFLCVFFPFNCVTCELFLRSLGRSANFMVGEWESVEAHSNSICWQGKYNTSFICFHILTDYPIFSCLIALIIAIKCCLCAFDSVAGVHSFLMKW